MFCPAAKATRTYPACAIEEYDSSRLTLFCTSAPMLPIDIDSTAETQIIQNHPGAPVANSTRSSTAKAAAFGPVDMNATTGAGEPSETSGVQTWKGAEATLKPSPTNIRATARYVSTETWVFRISPLTYILVDPAEPNTMAP